MEFLKERVYTALNADELKIGSKVITADTLASLKKIVESDQALVYTIDGILADDNKYRFVAKNLEWALAYLVSEKKLKWTDLKVGDVIRRKGEIRMVTGISTVSDSSEMHIFNGTNWLTDEELEEWEKVEE